MKEKKKFHSNEFENINEIYQGVIKEMNELEKPPELINLPGYIEIFAIDRTPEEIKVLE